MRNATIVVLAACIGALALAACSNGENGSKSPQSDAGSHADTDSGNDAGSDPLCNGPWVQDGEPCKNDIEKNEKFLRGEKETFRYRGIGKETEEAEE